MLAAPAGLACKESCTLRTQATQVQPEQPAFPAQWFYGLYVISSVRRAVWPPLLANHHPQAWSQRRGIGTARFRRTRSAPRRCATRVHRIPPHVSWRSAEAPLM